MPGSGVCGNVSGAMVRHRGYDEAIEGLCVVNFFAVMCGWQRLQQSLDRWGEAGRIATLWWRDDDATTMTPALRELLDAGASYGVPVALAVIPATAQEALAEALVGEAEVSVLQHGYAHRNYAPPAEKRQELGPHRPSPVMLEELKAGFKRLRQGFAGWLEPVLVPPWNRMDAGVLAGLADIGFRGVSAFGPRRCGLAGQNLRRANCHVDIIAWRAGRQFAGESHCLERLTCHLDRRLQGGADAAEVTGLLTHHLVHDGACWRFLHDLLVLTGGHPAARWLPVSKVFEGP